MTKTRSELWRPDREAVVELATQSYPLLRALAVRLQMMRETMHAALELPQPPEYATTSVNNIKLLCNDLDHLTVALVLRARGLTSESDEILAEGLVRDIEEDLYGGTPNPRGH